MTMFLPETIFFQDHVCWNRSYIFSLKRPAPSAKISISETFLKNYTFSKKFGFFQNISDFLKNKFIFRKLWSVLWVRTGSAGSRLARALGTHRRNNWTLYFLAREPVSSYDRKGRTAGQLLPTGPPGASRQHARPHRVNQTRQYHCARTRQKTAPSRHSRCPEQTQTQTDPDGRRQHASG